MPPGSPTPGVAGPRLDAVADDAYDRALLANVQPAGWQNPAPRTRYHLVVIGAGTAGLVSAAIAAGLGARVALVERERMGGDCLNVGCVPSKALLRAARAWVEARQAAHRFGGPAVTGDGEFAAAAERMRRMRADLSRVDGAARFRGLGVDVFFGHAHFTSADMVQVGGRTLRFRRAVIATGSRPTVPPIPGLADAGYVTNETVFSLTTLPRRLVVIGGGPIGCELAQAFARFGSAVTVLNAGPRLLANDDPDAAQVVEAALAADGVVIHHDARVTAAERRSGGAVLAFERGDTRHTVTGDTVLVAAGRTPNVEELGLDAAGVASGPEGIVVNDRMRTANRRVYAIGDCASRHRFTHAADAQARRVVPNALFFGLGGGRASDLVMSWCTYTSPEVAHVGLTAAKAAAAGENVETITVPMRDVDRAVLDGATDGFLRVHLRRGSDRILGATLVAHHAGDMIGELAVAVTHGVGLGKLGATIHPYPTVAEVMRKAADAWRRTKLTPSAQQAFALFFRLFR